MSYKLSVLVPSIRTHGLKPLYDSIVNACSEPFEMLVASPYDLPEELSKLDNVKLARTWRSPLAAQQEALTHATGEYISWCADDGICTLGSYDKAFKLLEGKDYKAIVTGKYQEGDRKDDNMEQDKYYILNNHYGSQALFLPKDSYMLNCGIVSRKILLELGGWDSYSFHVCPVGYNDLAIRLKKYECEFIISKEIMFICSHEPGETGTHGPIHRIQVFRDEPMYKEIYNHPYFSKRLSVDINNFERTAVKWEPRFGS